MTQRSRVRATFCFRCRVFEGGSWRRVRGARELPVLVKDALARVKNGETWLICVIQRVKAEDDDDSGS